MNAGAAAEKEGKTKKNAPASTPSLCAGGGHANLTTKLKETSHTPADGRTHDDGEADGDSAGGDGNADVDAGGGDGEDGAGPSSRPKSKTPRTQPHGDTEWGG